MTFAVPASIRMGDAPAALAAGVDAIARGETSFDFSGLASADSSTVSVCLAWQRAAATRGAALAMVNVPPTLKKLAALYGVDAILFAAHH